MAKKTKLPKTILGMKVPKELRKQGAALIDTVVDKANSPAGRELIAGALTMAAAAASAAAAKNRASRETPTAPPVPPVRPVPPVPPRGAAREPDFQAIAENVGKGAEIILDRLFGGRKA